MTNQFQPPEGLQPPGELIKKIATTICEAPEAVTHGSDKPCQWCLHDTVRVLAALFEACEVREERRIVIDDEQVTGLWLAAAWAGDCDVLAATYSSGRVERHFVIETAPEPVSSTGEAATR